MVQNPTRSRSGRPRRFDEADVVGNAVTAFWSHGYEGTTLDDLEQAHREINDGKDIYVVLEDEIIKLLNQELSSKIYDGRIKLAAKYTPKTEA